MAKTQTTVPDELKLFMWERLSSPPETLGLDTHADEEPEDLFVRICNIGRKRAVVNALKANLYSIIIEVQEKEKQAALRFMQRAIRLCDIIGAYECKPVLKLILLDESGTGWGKAFEQLQELAARALEGMPKEESEFEYWSHLVEKRNAILPYALNAVIEISLERGIHKLVQTYFSLPKKIREDIVNWDVILQLASETHGPKNLGNAIDNVFAQNPFAYEFFVKRIAKIPSLSRIGKRSIEDIASYTETSFVKEQEQIDLASLLPLFYYQEYKKTTAQFDIAVEKDKLTESYGKLYGLSETTVQSKNATKWKFYAPGMSIIPSHEN